MKATNRQIEYLCALARKVESIRQNYPQMKLPDYIDWQKERSKGVTISDASARIGAYKTIIRSINMIEKFY